MPRPIVATVHLDALRHNLSAVRRHAPSAHLWAVVKANAYGHGLQRMWQAFDQADGYALLNYEEAITLREAGWQGPILLLEGFFHAGDLALLDRYRLITAVHSAWQIEALAAARPDAPIDVYLKLNSGMNRLGFPPEQLTAAWQQLRALPQVGTITLMSHFAVADGPEGVNQQYAVIERVGAEVPLPRCLANSAATLWHPHTHHAAVRPGIILYGASPSGVAQDIAPAGLKAGMSLTSEIIGLQQLRAGDRVGYGATYTAAGPQRMGVVACGYADGYPRHAPTGTPVCVGGVMTRTLGRVSMDMLAVDLTPCPQAGIGTPVELWGAQLPVDEVAAAAGTLGYELLTAVTARVPFRYEN
ncbi:catabolic alanine racemase DadX [Chimaeribacter arupi]|uniref:catabolic alanine racemase DadX n=1 Tax=Chimaeribacter arupi TaxID=2060066 RepID=UPI0029456C42|nr:catabolic alanine racemase DadX [Chimaeribacter arupi]MDV5139191.1 catabolic alanine racemase DadX [Chimaeribacter arupi]